MSNKTWNRCCLPAVFVTVALAGCGSSLQNPPAKAPAPAVPAPAQTEAQPPAEGKEQAPAKTDEPAARVAPETKKTAQEPPAATSGKVLLGSPDLTAGIAGEGELDVATIQAWLDDPRNHEPLDFDLPFGLDAGKQNVKGVAENPLTRAKIELGRQLYFDKRLSADATVSCASCHGTDHGYAAETQFGVGIGGQTGNRNSPVAYNRIESDKQFWDGRAASLEDQAVGPIANPIEMGNTHEKCVATLRGIEGYQLQFEKIFGELTIQRVAQAIASFERVLVTGPTPFDYNEKFLQQFSKVDPADLEGDDLQAYNQAKADAEAHPMSASAKRGRELFFSEKAGCTACHAGANFTDEQYHNLGIGMERPEPDLGRFNVTHEEKDRGAFKTPTIRNVTLSAPYMHDGSQKTLEEVVEWYAKGGHPNPQLDPKIKKLELSEQDKKDLVEFMKACEGALPKVQTGRLPQ